MSGAVVFGGTRVSAHTLMDYTEEENDIGLRKQPHTTCLLAVIGRGVMQAVRIETTIGEIGEVRLTKLPFKAGERVEVIVLRREMRADLAAGFPLRGVPIAYDRPTDPVAEEEGGASVIILATDEWSATAQLS